ncbi:MAG: hypothetical protein PHD65_02210 [Gallionella sp.]|nr:hypothetical protein [Gallionella sp.]
MHSYVSKLLPLIFIFSISNSSFAEEALLDTSQNRAAIATRIVADGSFIMMVLDNEIQKLPIDKQAIMRQNFSKAGIMEAMQKALFLSFSENFTVSELIILEPLYGSKTGVDALNKFGKFNGDVAKNMILEMSRLRK